MAEICQFCGKGLSTKQWLNYHIARFHSQEFKDQPSSTDQVQSLLQVGGGKFKKDIFSDEESDSESNDESTESEGSDMEEDEEEDDNSEGDNKESKEDPDWVFEFILDQAKHRLDVKKAEEGVDYSIKDLRKRFRRAYGSILKWMHALRKNATHKKVVSTAHDLRDNSAGYDYNESIDAAGAKRKFLLDRLVSEEDLIDEENETETDLL